MDCPFCNGTQSVARASLDSAGHPVSVPIPCPHCTSQGDPPLVTLCGSTRFKEEFLSAQFRLTLEGNIVLTTAGFSHADNIDLTPEQKTLLDALHFAKIRKSQRVHVINKDQYIGESTAREIEYARKLGLEITYEFPVATIS